MFVSLPFHAYSSGQQDVRPNVPLPMVYEQVPVERAQWEYKVLSINVRKEELPDTTLLNELGASGWVLIGVLEIGLVHYYFVRQRVE